MSSLALLKQQHPHLKIVLSIGGGGQGSADFAAVARNDYTRSLFVANVKNLIDAHNFDGVDSTCYQQSTMVFYSLGFKMAEEKYQISYWSSPNIAS